MGYTDSLLAQGEVITRRSRQHWLALLLDSRAALAVWVVAIVLLVATIAFNLRPDVRNVVGIIILVLVAIGLVLFGYRLLVWMNQDYLVTNRRIMKVEGILNKRSMDSSLEKINDLVLDQNLIGRILDYGDLDIVTASDVAIDRFRMLNHAKEFKRVMLDQKHRLEYGEDMRLPGPPLMANAVPASATAVAPTPEPVPTSAPVAPSAMAPPPATSDVPPAPAQEAVPAADLVAPDTTSEPMRLPESPPSVADTETEAREITQTLARLADLRDSGAISAEDYEGKKAELLGRL